MATVQRIDIIVRTDGADRAGREIGRVGEQAERSRDRLRGLNSVLALVGGALAVDKVMQYADTWTEARGQIINATDSLEGAELVLKKVFDVAQNTRQPIKDMSNLFTRLSRSSKEVGASNEDMIKLTETVGMALAATGTSMTQARGALLQFAQAMGSGTVRAEEFNSIQEGAPILLNIVAGEMKGVGGSVADLRKLMIAGKLSSKDFYDALTKGADKVKEQFDKMPTTFSQAFTILENAVIKFIGEANRVSGLSNAFGTVAKFIANNFEAVIAILSGVATVLLVALAQVAIPAVMRAFAMLNTVIASSPLGRLGAVIAGVVAAILVLRNSISLTADSTATLGDFLGVAWERIKLLGSAIGSVFGSLLSMLPNVSGQVSITLEDVIRFIARAVDGIAVVIRTLVQMVLNSGLLIAKGFQLAFETAANAIMGLFNAIVEQISKVGQWVSDKFNLGLDFSKSFTFVLNNTEKTKAEIESALGGITGAFEQQIAIQGNLVENGAIKMIEDSKKAAATRIAAEKAAQDEINKNNAAAGAAAEDEKGVKLREKQAEAILAMRRQLLELNGATEVELAQFDIRNAKYAEFSKTGQRKVVEGLALEIAGVKDLTEAYKEFDSFSTEFLKKDSEARKAAQSEIDSLTQDVAKGAGGVTNDPIAGIQARQNQELMELQNHQAELRAQHQLNADEITKIDELTAQRRSQINNKAEQDILTARLNQASQFFGNMATLSQTGNKKLQKIGKAAAIAQAIVSGALAVQNALAVQPYPVGLALAASAAVATGVNIATIQKTQPGFREGGFTGMGGVNDIAGVVHGREFVMNAEATARNRPLLDRMNRGEQVNGTGSSGINVSIQNFGTSKEFEVEQLSESEVRIIARDEARSVTRRETPAIVSGEISNPNSQVSKSLERNLKIERNR